MDAALIFGLGPLYLVAGWLSSRSVSRHGSLVFLRSRLLRLGLPTVVFLGVIGPAAAYLGNRAEGGRQSWRDLIWPPLRERDLGPMWFVAALLAFSVLYALYRQFRPAPRLARTALTPGRLAAWVLLIGVADFSVRLRWDYSSGSVWNFNWAHWPQSAGMFLLGAVAYERGWLDAVPESLARSARRANLGGPGLLSAVAVVSIAVGGDYAALAGGWHWRTGPSRCWTASSRSGFAVWVVAAAQRAGTSRCRRACGEPHAAPTLRTSSTPSFSCSSPPSCGISPGRGRRSFIALALVGVPACFVIGHLLTRLRYVNRIL